MLLFSNVSVRDIAYYKDATSLANLQGYGRDVAENKMHKNGWSFPMNVCTQPRFVATRTRAKENERRNTAGVRKAVKHVAEAYVVVTGMGRGG
jgi:hypothetical protein